MNPATQPTVDGHAALESGTSAEKETYASSYTEPWYRQGKWRVFMLIAGIVIIGAIVGGVVGGVVSHNNKNNKSSGPGPSVTLSVASVDTSIVSPAQPTEGPLLSTSSTPSPQSSTGAAAQPNGTGRPPQVGGDVVNIAARPAALIA